MSSQIVQEIKSFESLVQNLVKIVKSIETNTEELKSMANLLERIAKSVDATHQHQQKMAESLEKAWGTYATLKNNQK